MSFLKNMWLKKNVVSIFIRHEPFDSTIELDYIKGHKHEYVYAGSVSVLEYV